MDEKTYYNDTYWYYFQPMYFIRTIFGIAKSRLKWSVPHTEKSDYNIVSDHSNYNTVTVPLRLGWKFMKTKNSGSIVALLKGE